ncbi:MAG: carboxy-S-adenosyl-L-methionine synthase CmoA [Gemmatimonadota bacterium]
MTPTSSQTVATPANGVEPVTDKIFAQPTARVDDFVFDGRTAGVFDDMLGRSVPFYAEIQRMSVELAADFATPGSNVYDLGCSTGTTFAALHPKVEPSVRFIGIDDSPEMLDKARQKLAHAAAGRQIDLVRSDLHELATIENASVVFLTLTLQFVRPLHRERLVRAICEGTNDQGCLILVEKLTESDTLFNRLFIKYYYDMKRRNGYSELEISQKREALENVLIPYRAEENREMLLAGGYRRVQPFFQWYNFAGVIAVK